MTKKNKTLYAHSILSIGACAIAIGSLIVCLSLVKQQEQSVKKLDEVSEQILKLATIIEPSKGEWAENVKPGFNHFHSSAFGHFDYPTEWGEPSIKKVSCAKGLYGGSQWTLSFSGQGPLGDWVRMEAYQYNPAKGIDYPFNPKLSAEELALTAAAALTQGTSASACTAYQSLNALTSECQKFSESIFFITDPKHSESVWFVPSPQRTDTTQQADYPGVVIHASDGHEAEIRTLLSSLQAQGTWNLDPQKIKELE